MTYQSGKFQTGNNQKKGLNLLELVREEVVRRGCTVEKEIKDSNGAFALLIREGSVWAYVVARATGPMDGVWVSTQATFLRKAAKEEALLIMLVNGDYVVYDPKRILMEYDRPRQLNTRLNEPMLNFSDRSADGCENLGMPWTGSLDVLWTNFYVQYQRFRKTRLTMFLKEA